MAHRHLPSLGDPRSVGLRSAGYNSPALPLSKRWEADSSQPGGGLGVVQGAIKIRDYCRLQISFAAFPSAHPSDLAVEFGSESAAAAHRQGWIRSEVGVRAPRLWSNCFCPPRCPGGANRAHGIQHEAHPSTGMPRVGALRANIHETNHLQQIKQFVRCFTKLTL